MPIEIRNVPADQLRHYVDAVNVAFGEPTDEAQLQLDKPLFETKRVLGGYDGDALVGGGAAFSFRMTVPGGARVPDGGSDRRSASCPLTAARASCASSWRVSLPTCARNGEPLAALVASEGSIYQRFGYGFGTLWRDLEIDRDRAAFRVPTPPVGTVRLRRQGRSPPADAARLRAGCAATPGFIERDPAWWDERAGRHRGPPARRRAAVPRHLRARRRRSAATCATASSTTGLTSPSANTLIINELIGADPIAERELWRYVFGVDLIARIKHRWGPPITRCC